MNRHGFGFHCQRQAQASRKSVTDEAQGMLPASSELDARITSYDSSLMGAS
jgi:hypothetical protein